MCKDQGGEACGWRVGQDCISLPCMLPSLSMNFHCLLRTVSSLLFFLFSTSSPGSLSSIPLPFTPISCSIFLPKYISLPCRHLFSHTGIASLVHNRCLLSLLNECRATANLCSYYKRYPLWADVTPQQDPLGCIPLFSEQPAQTSTAALNE